MTMVPYKGLAPAFTDLLSGNIHMVSATPVELKPFIESKKVKMLVSSGRSDPPCCWMCRRSRKPSPAMPWKNWNGVLVPANTPQAIVDALVREMIAAKNSLLSPRVAADARGRSRRDHPGPVRKADRRRHPERGASLCRKWVSTCSDETHLGRGNGALAVHPRWLLLSISFAIHLFSWDWIYAARNQQVEAVGQSPSHRPADGRDHYQSRPQAAPTKQRRILGANLLRCEPGDIFFAAVPTAAVATPCRRAAYLGMLVDTRC